MDNLPYLLALNKITQLGPRSILKLQQRWPNLEELFKLSNKELQEAGLSATLAQSIACLDLRVIEEDLRWETKAPDHHLLSWDHPQYPALLKEIVDPPVILYAQGQLSAFDHPPLAIVGSRNPSITGSNNARQFAKDLAASGVSIISGLALGIDAQAHQGCLDASGYTIAVLGTGIDCIYPRRHTQLAVKIAEQGLLLSEFPLKSPPVARHFPRRNRIISGLSLCILVVEAAIKSGSLITARMAIEQNRDVLAIPGSIHNPLAQGCHYLLQQGAKLVSSVNDVLEELGIERYEPLVKNQKNLSMDKKRYPLASDIENLVKFIGFETTSIDQIIVRSRCTVEQVTDYLTQLELQGLIIAAPGGYIRV